MAWLHRDLSISFPAVIARFIAENDNRETRLLELLVEAHEELCLALRSLNGRKPETLHVGYLYHASAFIGRASEAYILLRKNGLIDASQILVRPALEASFRIRAVAGQAEILFPIAFDEFEEDMKWAAGAVGTGDVAATIAKVEADWEAFKRDYQTRFPEHNLEEKKRTLRQIAEAAGCEGYYDSHYRLYCKITHAALRATSGSLRAFAPFDSPAMAGCVFAAITALQSIGASAPRLKSLWDQFTSVDSS